MIDQAIAISSPFVFAILLQLLIAGVPSYAKLLLNNNLVRTTVTITNDETKNLIIDLALLIYTHLSFVFGILTASVSCIAFTTQSQRGLLAAAGALIMLSVIPYWIVSLQTLTVDEVKGKKGKVMRLINLTVILLLWAITLYATFSPPVTQSPSN